MNDTKLTIAGAEKRRVPTEVYSRIVGYLRPLTSWNEAKLQEFEDRVVFKFPEEEG